jgi:hypothetical protein
MDIILVVLLVLLVGIASSILYLNLKSKPKDDNENKEAEEIANLKTEIQNLKDTLIILLIRHLAQCRPHLIIFYRGYKRYDRGLN